MADHAGRIDVHLHSVPRAYRTALVEASVGPEIRIPEWTPDLAIEMMDRHGIAGSVPSLSVPGTHLGNDEEARKVARRCNEEAAEWTARHPRRLGAFATLPLPDVDGAVREAQFALAELKLDGVGLLSSYGERYLGDPLFDPLLEVLNDFSAVVTIHPNSHPSTKSIRLSVPDFLIEFLFDTTRAAVNLIFSGALDRFPNIRFILSHAGGTLPFISWRLADIAKQQLALSPFRERYRVPLIEQSEEVTLATVLTRVRQFYFDTALSPGPQTFGSLKAVADPQRILFGSDWPYCSEPMVADMIDALSDAAALGVAAPAAIARENAVRLFPRFQ